MVERPRNSNGAVLVGLDLGQADYAEGLHEMQELAASAGVSARAVVRGRRERPDAALFAGKGKVEEIAREVGATGSQLVIFNHELTPVQERNLERTLGCRVVDRVSLILDIFAQRARTHEGKLQVELAQLTYLLPRLVGQWKHLERLGGGIGTRGPGETQLESDRRVIRRRVMQIRSDLEGVQVHRRLQRAGRRRAGVPVVALVGYTNAGKTTLLNRLTGARLTAADQLFVTLDPAARLVEAPDRHPFILTDTVGFIRKLPHELVAAFRATLEELQDADVLVHVVDASHPALDEHVVAVERILRELGVGDRPTVLAFNKVDRTEGGRGLQAQVARGAGVAVSATTGEGIAELLKAIDGAWPSGDAITVRIPHADGAALALCYERGRVLARVDESAHVVLDVHLPAPWRASVAGYRVLN